MGLFFSRRQRDASTSLRLFGMLWLSFLLVVGALASITVNVRATATPYAVTITSNNFHVPFVTVATDDISDPSSARFSLQNGSSLWYSINVTSTPAGIVPGAATTTDLVSTTLLGSTPSLLPPAKVLPFDASNGSYTFETLKLKTTFSGPGQQVQLELTPLEQHAVALDVLTLLLQLLGQKQNNLQIGLLETGVLQDVFTELGNMRDFTSLVSSYTQILEAQPNATLPHAYDCAQNIASLLSDNNEQSALADVLWKVLGKAIARDSILKTIEDFSQTQFGLAIEGFINSEAGTMTGVFSQDSNPTVLLQTVSTATPSVTPSQSPSPSLTTTATPSTSPSSSPTTAPSTATPVGAKNLPSTPNVLPTASITPGR